MKKNLVYLRPSRLAYVRVTGPYTTSVPQAWDRMIGWLEKNGIRPLGERGYGLFRDNPNRVPEDQCRYDACIPIAPEFHDRAERDLGTIMLPGGPYARSRHNGGYGKALRLTKSIYDEPALPQDLRFDDRRPLVTIYLDDPRRFSARELRCDICVPVAAIAIRDRVGMAA